MLGASFNQAQEWGVPTRRDPRQQLRDRNMSGYAAIGANPQGDNQARETNRIIGSQYAPAAVDRARFQAGLEGDFQQTVGNLLDRLMNRNYAQTADRQKAYLQQNANQAARQQQLAAQEMGLGAGYQGGQFGQSSNDLQRMLGNVDLYYNDPMRQEEDLQQALQLLFGVQQENPFADYMSGLDQSLFSAEQYKAQQRANQGIGGALGSVLGGLDLGSIFGGRAAPQQVTPSANDIGKMMRSLWL